MSQTSVNKAVQIDAQLSLGETSFLDFFPNTFQPEFTSVGFHKETFPDLILCSLRTRILWFSDFQLIF